MLTLARSVSERGELVLLRRADGTLELRVNGVFAMDTAETSSERLLAAAALDAAQSAAGRARVVVGGLGLGYTLAALVADDRVAHVLVAEIEPDLVRWHASGVVPPPDGVSVLEDSRVDLYVGDVRECMAAQPEGSLDLVLLDVDNGPGFLLYDANAVVYESAFLSQVARALAPGGTAAVWSASESDDLERALAAGFTTTQRVAIPVVLNQRRTEYFLYLGCGPRESAEV